MTSTISRAMTCRPSVPYSEVQALANILNKSGFSADTVAEYGIGQWHMAALAANVRDPDREAQTMVVRLLRDPETFQGRAFDRWLKGYRHRLEESRENSGRETTG